jgi:thiamine biosynthesis lipoprotein
LSVNEYEKRQGVIHLKKTISLFLLIILITLPLTGCEIGMNKYRYQFTGLFDTVIEMTGYAKNEKSFTEMAELCKEFLEELNALFDIYNDYEGIPNIKTVNDMAGIAPVKVDPRILDLIEFAKTGYEQYGYVNIAMGPVLKIWHDYRTEGSRDPENARLPDIDELKEAAKKTDIQKVIVNREEGTVFLEDAGMSLDVGAIAKGYAVEMATDYLTSLGYTSFILSAGGNVKACGKPADGREKWGIGLQDPDANPFIPEDQIFDTVYVRDLSVVTSGNYQRYYYVDDKKYHHIISGETLMPADLYKAVTVVIEDSAWADFFSTALFLMPYSELLRKQKMMYKVEKLVQCKNPLIIFVNL